MTNEIHSTAEIAEGNWDGQSEPSEVETDMVATDGPTGDGIEFHVSMRGYTMHDMEDLIVQAAARQILGTFNDRAMAKTIEETCTAQLTAKADAVLSAVTTEIIDQPLTPSFGDKKPVTMREFIGLTGREYLSQKVDSVGKPTSGYGAFGTRMEYLVRQYMDRHFRIEIEKATNAVITEIRKDFTARHEKMLASEKKRLREAFDKLTAA